MRFASCLLSRIGKDFRFHVRDRQRFYRLLDVEVACYLDSRTKALAAGIVIVGIERPSAFAATCGGDVKRKRRQEARAGSVGRKRGQEAWAGSAGRKRGMFNAKGLSSLDGSKIRRRARPFVYRSEFSSPHRCRLYCHALRDTR